MQDRIFILLVSVIAQHGLPENFKGMHLSNKRQYIFLLELFNVCFHFLYLLKVSCAH